MNKTLIAALLAGTAITTHARELPATTAPQPYVPAKTGDFRLFTWVEDGRTHYSTLPRRCIEDGTARMACVSTTVAQEAETVARRPERAPAVTAHGGLRIERMFTPAAGLVTLVITTPREGFVRCVLYSQDGQPLRADTSVVSPPVDEVLIGTTGFGLEDIGRAECIPTD